MDKAYSVLPCNGLDKCEGSISKETALQLAERSGCEIICPVFSRIADVKYNKIVDETSLIVIDGCATRCASKMAAELGWKISKRILVRDEATAAGVQIDDALRLDSHGIALAADIAEHILAEAKEVVTTTAGSFYPDVLDYDTYTKDKFIFSIPKNKGFYFNENDVWVYVAGNMARVGITDYVQKSMSDIMFFTPPDMGDTIEQFDELGVVESAKAVFEVVSPVGGKIIAVNDKLEDAPELLNQSPYEQGWIADIELTNLEDDLDLLHDFEGYLPILKQKVDEYNA